MIEIQNTGSLFYLSQNEHEAVVVTTNGVIRKNGDAVLGKGQALEAKKLFPGMERQSGEYLRRYGNRAFYMGTRQVGEHLTSLVTVHMSRNYTVSAKTREEAMKKAEEKFRTACKNSKRYIDCGDTVVVNFIEEMEDAHGL